MRAAPLGQHGVGHPPPQVGRAIASRLARGQHGVVQVGQGKHRHPLAVAVETRQMRVDRAAALGQHLHRKGLPRGVGRPELLVANRRLGRKFALEVVVRPLAHTGADGVLQVGRRLVDVQHVGGEIRRHGLAGARPVSESAALALERLDLLQRLLRHRTHLRWRHAGQRERVTQVGREHERQRRRGFLFDAAVGILDQIPSALAETHHRRGRQLHVESPVAWHYAGGNRDRFARAGRGPCCLAVGRHRLWRRQDLDRQHVFERIALGAETRAHPDACAAHALGCAGESDFHGVASADRNALFGRPREREHRRVKRGHRDGGGAACGELTADDRAEVRLVAHRQEAREGGGERDGFVGAHLGAARAEARPAVAGHRHDAIGGQRLGQRDVDAGAAIGAGHDRAHPERQHAEVLAQRARAGIDAAATALAAALGRQHAPRHDALAVVGVEDLQRLAHVDRPCHIGRLVAGEREHAVVHSPQRHFARRAHAGHVLHVDAHGGLGRRTVFRPVGCDRHGKTRGAVLHLEFDVAQSKRRLAGIARIGGGRGSRGIGRRGVGAALHEQHRHEHVRDVGLGDGHRDRLLRGGQSELTMAAHTLAFGRDERRGLFPRRLDHDARRVAGLVGLPFGHEIDAVVIEAFPGRVALAEHVERRARHGKASVVAAPARLEHEETAGRKRDRQGHRLSARRHTPGPGGHFLALGVPGVEAVALGASHARVLHLRERHIDRHAGGGRAIEPHRHDLGREAVLLFEEVRRAPHTHVPRRRMHGEAGAVGDVLTRHIFHVAFERVDVGNAGLALGVERERQIAGGRERALLASQVGAAQVPAEARRLSDEDPPVVAVGVRDDLGRLSAGGFSVAPRDGLGAHGRAKQIPCGHHAVQRIPRQPPGTAQRDIHAEVGPAIRGHQKRAVDDAFVGNEVVVLWTRLLARPALGRRRRLRAIRGENRAHRVVAERALGRQSQRPLGAAPRRERHGAFVDTLVLSIAHAHQHRRAFWQQSHARGRVLPQDRLERDGLAQLVDAAIGEDAAAQQRVALVQVREGVEIPGQDALVPVAAHIRDVAVLLGRDQEREPIPVLRIAQRRVGRHRDPVGAGRAAPERLVVGAHDRHSGASHGRARIESGHEHERVQRAVFHRDAQVRHLHDRGPRGRPAAAGGAPGARQRVAVANRRPHEPGAACAERARYVEAVRLHAVGRHGETPRHAVAGRRYGEGACQLRLQRGHELRGVEPEHPLGNRAQVARVEGQLRSAVFLPHAVAVAEARERRGVPVVDDVQPRVAQRLSVFRHKCRRRRHGVLAIRWLHGEAGVFERQVAAGFRRELAARRTRGGLAHRLRHGRAEIRDPKRGGK